MALASDTPTAPAADEQTFIEYQLRANEDPSKVAQMFHVTVEELLALNHITDPRRLGVGTTLKIPDPRATVVKQLTMEKRGLETQLASAQSTIAGLQQSAERLDGQLADLRDANDTLSGEAARSRFWRLAVFATAAVAAVLAVAFLVACGKGREAARHAEMASREAQIMRAAVDKYRQLSAQFELKYQNLFHQVGMPSPAQARAQALRAAYDEDRARLDAIVAEAERELADALNAVSPQRAPRPARNRVTALAPARKSG